MSESRRIKGSSVAAFMLLPQFNLCFEGMSHIVPVLMRTIALAFAQAGLLAENHPATRYGIEGVRKYRISELIGEAWFTLRTTRANSTQWGVFVATIMMFVTFIAAIGTFFLRVVFGMGAAAQAQIFTHPAGFPTDMAAVLANGTSPGGMLDKRIGAVGTYAGDYALSMLDKIVRQSAVASPGTGGAMQNALASLMQVYNTGVTIVAGVMIFWLITSVVADTAKTGTIGGGRHNMVWAPIRIVFALGLMIPLGSAGFSSGQYMVMKLAEWGSNFGSQGWSAYVTAVGSGNNMLARWTAHSASHLVDGLAQIKTCQVAYNTYVYQSTVPDPNQIVFVNGGTGRTMAGAPSITTANSQTFTYTNATDGNLCGKVSYPLITGSDITSAVTRVGSFLGDPSLMTAALTFRASMATAITAALTSIEPTATQFACAFVSKRFSNGGTGPNPVSAIPECSGVSLNSCGATATTDPNLTCHTAMNNALVNGVTAAYAGPGATALNNYITGPLMTNATARGWGGMGAWYHTIASLNITAQTSTAPNVTVSPGTITSAAGNCAQPHNAGGNCTLSGIADNTGAIMRDYTRWWQGLTSSASVSGYVAPATGATPAPQAGSGASGNQAMYTGGGSFSVWDLILAPATLATTVMGSLLGVGQASGRSYFWFDIVEDTASNTYPLAELSATGAQIVSWGLGMLTGVTAAQVLVALAPGIGEASSNSLFELIAMIAKALIVSGLVLAFYLPVLPFIRVAFAVLTWMISVFEAVVMVPIAALAHLTTEGEGLAGGARSAWILWLNVLMRPILVVIGFVAAMLIFNSFAVFFQHAFVQAAVNATQNDSGPTQMFASLLYTIIFVGSLYTAANTTFKLLDLIPSAMMRWIGGTPDQSFDDNDAAGYMMAASNMLRSTHGGGMAKAAGSWASAQRAQNPGATPSDISLKENIVPMGQENGHNVYAFSYKGDPQRYIGVMAQEVEKTHPHAVTMMNGHKAVYYGMIGVKFRKFDA